MSGESSEVRPPGICLVWSLNMGQHLPTSPSFSSCEMKGWDQTTPFCDSVPECKGRSPDRLRIFLLSLSHSTLPLINPKGSHICRAKLTVL